nr:zinc finger, CCHC-type [Tanacetum cinerariifolium]
MKAGEKAALMKKAYSTLILCLGDRVLREVTKETTAKKSSGFVKKGKHDQDSDSSDDEGNTYFGEAPVVVRNDEMTELVMDSGGSYHMTHMRDFLYDFKVVDGGSVWLGDNKTCTIKGTEKVKIQLHNESSFILEDVSMKVQNKLGFGFKEVGFKQLGHKQVGFKQLGHKQVEFKQLGPDVKT